MIYRTLCILLLLFLSGCSSPDPESTMKGFIQVMKTSSGSFTAHLIEKDYCVSSFSKDIKSMSLNTRLIKGGFRFAPYRFLAEKQRFDIDSLRFKSSEEISKTKLKVTFGTKTHDIVSHMQYENQKWLFCIGPITVYELKNGERKLVDSKLYTFGKDFD